MSTYGNQLDEATVAERVKLWEEVNAEDREKLERMQVALRSAHALAATPPASAPAFRDLLR